MSYHFYDMGFKDGYKKALQQLDEQRGGMGGGMNILPGNGNPLPGMPGGGPLPSRMGNARRAATGGGDDGGVPDIRKLGEPGGATPLEPGMPKGATLRLQWPWGSAPGEFTLGTDGIWYWTPTAEPGDPTYGDHPGYGWDADYPNPNGPDGRWVPWFAPTQSG